MAAAGAPSRRSTLTPWGDRISPRGRRPAIAVRPVQACAEETAGRGAHPAREPALVLSERILWDLQAYLDRAARRGAFLHVAERAQQVAHGLVGLQHETREARDALLPCPRGEATQQQRPQSAPLPVIGHRHGGLRLVGVLAGTHVTGHPEAVAARGLDGDERLVVVMIDLGQVRQLRGGEPCGRAEETAVARQLRQALKAGCQARLVLAAHRADLQRAAVAQLNVAHADRTIAHTEPRHAAPAHARRGGFAPRPRSVANARRPAPRARRRGTTAVTLRSCPAGGPSSRTNAGARPATRFMRTRSCWASWPSRWRPRSRSCSMRRCA